MNFTTLKKSMTRKVVVLLLPVLLLLGAGVSNADARDHHRGRGKRQVQRQVHRNGYHRGGGRGYYRGRGYAQRRHHGYWRRHNGRRYWYQDGGYYASPGGLRITIGL